MNFGIMFFPGAEQSVAGDKFRLLIDATRYADQNDFTCVWTPERHFHEFGGLFPNPSLTSAALAMITGRLQIRAGSLISPLHHSIRVAEEWAFVDNLSGGRVAVSFGAGWNVDDFVFFPERYAKRQRVMYEQIEAVRRLWRGEPLTLVNSSGREVSVNIYPKPVQPELPVWVTSSGNTETFASAGAIGANLLTHLIGQDLHTLAEKIGRYRKAREEGGFDPSGGVVSLMLHTFVGSDIEAVRAKVRGPFREYLRSAVSLEQKAAIGGGVISGGHKIAPGDINEAHMDELLDLTFERYFQTASLLGTPDTCKSFVWRLKEIGVDEIACLIDFLDDYEAIMGSLERLDELRASFSEDSLGEAARQTVSAFTEDLE
jgi:natural product biosynthesis luciferase-like monooxygenase protein